MEPNVSSAQFQAVLAYLREGKADRNPVPAERRLAARTVNARWRTLRRRMKGIASA